MFALTTGSGLVSSALMVTGPLVTGINESRPDKLSNSPRWKFQVRCPARQNESRVGPSPAVSINGMTLWTPATANAITPAHNVKHSGEP